MLETLGPLAETIRKVLEAKNAAREDLITQSRVLIRHCANSIRAVHRQEWDNAQSILATAREVLDHMRESMTTYPDLYFAGYTQDALKEYVEAATTYALVRDEPLPSPQDLGMEESTYLNGLTEAASELRRYILDILRREHTEEAERLLDKMDTIYDMMVTFDFPDAISGGLRHRTDNLRGVLERTRGDMTLSVRQQRLQAALERAEQMLKSEESTQPTSDDDALRGKNTPSGKMAKYD
jgi:translin